MTGVGEIVAPLALPALDAVLVNPGAPAPTGAVYAAFDAMSAPAALDARATPAWATPAAAVEGLAALRNDLFAPACAVAPAIADAAAALARFDAVKLVRLSGSGATLVAYVSDANAAARLSARIAADYPSWWVARTRLG
jgi:4-diphosphocytidyl-2-C-methyl-D-erythritol kinase